MKKIIALLILIVLMACSSIKVSYDYDRQADFSKYKTYAFSEESMDMGLDQLNRDRVIDAVKNQMALKGFIQSHTPEVVVDIHVKGEKKTTATATTTGTPRMYRYGGYATTQVTYDEYIEGTMFITLVDKAEDKIIWQGIGTKTIDENASPEKREESINSSVEKIMANYPPESE
jgi:hypothetical protein